MRPMGNQLVRPERSSAWPRIWAWSALDNRRSLQLRFTTADT
jgi:hypothetical protein